MSVRRTDGPSWKIHVCSKNKWTLLENYKKVAPGKKEQIFSKTVSVAVSVSLKKCFALSDIVLGHVYLKTKPSEGKSVYLPMNFDLNCPIVVGS